MAPGGSTSVFRILRNLPMHSRIGKEQKDSDKSIGTASFLTPVLPGSSSEG